MYYLAQHIFVCPSGSEAVLLDLTQDRYLALNAEQAALLGEFLQGWRKPESTGGENGTPPSNEATTLARAMEEEKLLVADARRGKPAAQPKIPAGTSAILALPITHERKIQLRHVLALLYAVALASLALRWQSIEQVVSCVSRRRTSRQHSQHDLQTTRQLVDIFFRLRPFLFRSHNACLFDSLVLIHFLAGFGEFPQWVFGVRTDPFAAHCWVQQGDILLNDSVEHVMRYTPIMVA